MGEADRHPAVRRLQRGRDRHRNRNRIVRIGFAVLGFAVVAAGVTLLVLPGPGLVLIALGLAMLALEFAWAERLLARTLVRLDNARPQSRRANIAAGAASVALVAAAVAVALLWDVPLLPF